MRRSKLLLLSAAISILPVTASDVALATGVNIGGKYESYEYRNVGPTRGGRVTAVAGTVVEEGTYYLGASGGGVWKTEDYGTTWANVSDGYFATPSIGDISVAQNDANIVYVGTGSDGLRSNVIAGKGVYRSMDGGKTWTHVGLEQTGQIGAVEIDPRSNDTVYVAAIGHAFGPNEERGLYKTTDGGETWQKILYISDTVGIVDVEMHPSNPNILYASAWKADRKPWTIDSGGEISEGDAGIYKSIDGGDTWKKINNGLPTGLVGKIDLAVTPANSSVLAANVEAPAPDGGLYWSVDQGETWKHISNDRGIQNRPFYYTNLDIDPKNEKIIYSNANPLRKSVDGGKTWTTMSVPHGDNHDMWINPNNPDLFIQANDGGANVTFNGGKTWSTQFNQPTTELYQVEVDDQHPYWLYGGMQDNGSTISVPSNAPFGTQHTNAFIQYAGGCETGPAVPKPGNHNIVYSNCKGRFGTFDKRTGTERAYYVGATNIYGHNPANLRYRFQRVAPIHVSPHDPDTVYHASQYLHRTRDDGVTWETISPDLTANDPERQVISGQPITRDITGEEYYSTIYSVQESTLEPGVIWIGANDGPIHVTRDDGATWEDVTPRMPEGGRVDSVAPSPHTAGKAYVTVLRYQFDDWTPYIYKTTDYGDSWDLITDGIPSDFPVRVVRESPDHEGLLVAGTEYGMFVSANDGDSWEAFQQNLPVTPVTDIKFIRGDLAVSTMGRGFWVLDNVQSAATAATASGNVIQVLKPKDTYRYRRPRGVPRDGTAAGVPELPRPTVAIDYFVPDGEHQSIKLEITDAQNDPVSAYYNDGSEPDDMGVNAPKHIATMDLEMDPGLNRFRWDMTWLGPWHSNPDRRYGDGPIVTPGTYNAKITLTNAAGQAQVSVQHFDLMVDPRVTEQGINVTTLTAQTEFQILVSELFTKARKLEVEVAEEHSGLHREYRGLGSDQRSAEVNAEFDRVHTALRTLRTPDIIYPKAGLIGMISYLYNINSDADQRPGKDSIERLAELSAEFDAVEAAYRDR